MNWYKEFPVAVTVTDPDGNIVEMNDKSAEVFEKYGGRELYGKNLNECHNPHSQSIINDLKEKHINNIYTIEKNGVKKLIYQAPWFSDGEYAGLVELSIILPDEMPHFVR